MNDYQKYLIDLFSKYRIEPKYPTYPTYHEGLYLEDYFFDKFIKLNKDFDRYYIPVFWTTCYNDNVLDGLQNLLDSLDQSKKYFTISQHDDAVKERLPSDTICFNAGGNAGGIPIPLICSPIKNIQSKNRDIFCSFVGSITHPIRYEMYQYLINDTKYHISAKNWTNTITQEELNNFKDITSRSIFCLSPRGYGKNSFRIYESMQLGAIPVIINDQKWLPFEDELDWNKFSVLIDYNNIRNIDKILSSYTEDTIKNMQKNLSYYWINNFTMDSVCNKILEKI